DLARAFARGANLLTLDEPTNDLDVETLDMLEEALAEHPGTLILVSHDRDFLDRVATSVIVDEGRGEWCEYAGGYSDMVAQRGRGVGAASAPASTPQKAKPARESASAREAAPAAKAKLGFKERRALETLPDLIDALGRDIDKLRAALCDAGLFARDPKRFAAITEALGRAETERAASEDEWLRLEGLREASEA
ncbi:MAG: ABC transporter ATP-binding protein, partial [Hyphomicrobiales bacterium]|nr:ABC transporter ATP-binding protein [Hyphomicrobiales bacterium]